MWLRRRLGCAGSARLRIVAGVGALLDAPAPAPDPPLGWTDAELAQFAEACQLDDVAATVIGRGDAAALARIAWWGAALADLAPLHSATERHEVMHIGAAFNLAVALFDTAIDQDPIPRLALVEALAPQRLRARLHAPDDSALCLRSEHPAAARVVALFDRALSLSGRRFAADPPALAALAALLEAMYRSVLGQSDDPFIAKTGPVRFIGEIAAGAEARPFYAALARFCQLWDDSLDIAEDLAALAPNHFLGKGRGIDALATLTWLARGATRVVAGHTLHGGIERELARALGASLDAAAAWHADVHARTTRLCRLLIS